MNDKKAIDKKDREEIRDLAAEAGSLTEFAYRRLREDIIAGHFPSGAKLQIEDLKARYGLSASPVREALSRLISQGFVASESQRGFRVAPMSAEDLADITLARQVVESAALALAIRKGDDAWEGEVLSAFHKLDRHVLRLGGRPVQDLAAFSELHKAFHAALIAACGSPRLIEEQSRLYDQAERYRHGMMYSFLSDAEVDLMGEHRALMEAVLARDADAALRLLHHHLGHTYEFCFGKNAAENSGPLPSTGQKTKRPARS
ncbi:FCD domain-containing protein [Ferrovibrio sp.]|uniref:FCD domain-containing protein n=1 Tax=Ferrovibrio sp. TaxID=1917215 RepID=UPI0025BCDEF7|nr:FCD domain-containing protein [Ferrovibrio sp.]MBX3455378.1 FCD domain-containing protein [Ferrovibrio sp.]